MSSKICRLERGEQVHVPGYQWDGASRIAHAPDEWKGVTSVVIPSPTYVPKGTSPPSVRATFSPIKTCIAGDCLFQAPCIEIYAQADAPDQYDPSKTATAGEGSIFDEVMGEFNDFEGDDNYDDEY